MIKCKACGKTWTEARKNCPKCGSTYEFWKWYPVGNSRTSDETGDKDE